MEATQVIIVGAGVAGLRCGQWLVSRGIEVQVFEASDRVGGRIATDRIDGYQIDRGFQLLNPSYPQARRALDLARLDLKAFAPGMIVHNGTTSFCVADPLRAPVKSLRALSAPLGSMRSRVGLVKLLGGIRFERHPSLIDPDCTAKEWFNHHGIDESAIENLLQPFLAGVTLEDHLDTSARVVALLLRSFLRGTPGVPAGGMEAIPLQLAEHLGGRITMNAQVVRVDPRSVTLADGTVVSGDVVVVATPSNVTGTLLGGPAPSAMNPVTTWWYATDEPLKAGATLIVYQRQGPLVNTLEMTSAAPSYAPPGKHLVAASALGLHAGVDDEQTVRTRLAQLHDTPTRSWSLISRSLVPYALPSFRPPADLVGPQSMNDVLVAGDGFATPSTQGAMASGERAGRAALQRLQ